MVMVEITGLIITIQSSYLFTTWAIILTLWKARSNKYKSRAWLFVSVYVYSVMTELSFYSVDFVLIGLPLIYSGACWHDL